MTPLDVDNINREIFEYMDHGNYLFCATVCRTWLEAWTGTSRDTLTDVRSGDMSLSQIRECVGLGSETVTMHMLKTVAKSGDMNLLKVLCSAYDGLVSDGRVLTSAVSSGNFGMVKWLFHEHGCSTAWDPLDEAAKRGDVEMYVWLRHRGATRTWVTASKAASMGHLDMLRVIRDDCNGDGLGSGFVPVEYEEAVSSAIRNKQYHVLDWIQESGCIV